MRVTQTRLILLTGFLLGGVLGVWRAPLLLRKVSLDPEAWGLVEAVDRAQPSQLVVEGGALVLEGQGEGRTGDHLQLGRLGVLKRIEVDLQERSGPVELKLIDESGGVLETHQVEPGTTNWQRVTDPAATGIELWSQGRSARITRLHLVDQEDQVVLVGNFYLWGRGSGGAVGGGVGLLLAGVLLRMFRRTSGRRPFVRAGFLLALPLWVLLSTPQGIELWLQKLYLVRMEPGVFGRWLLLASLVPVFFQLLWSTSWLKVESGERRMPDEWWVLAIVAATAAARVDILELLILVPWILAPLWLARRLGLDERAWVTRDMPAWVVLALLGWQAGLFFSVVWRLVCLAAVAGELGQERAVTASSWLLLLLLVLPFSMELGLRSTWLDTGWNAGRLAGLSQDGDDWELAVPFWTDDCGGGEQVLSVAYAGGSATGGAYQFKGRPELFFPAQVQSALCASVKEDQSFQAFNFGRESADSFTISRSLHHILNISEPDLLVLYVGMNDLMTASSPYSRKELEARAVEFKTLDGLVGLSSRSRLLTGMSLAFRRQPVEDLAAMKQQARIPGYATSVPLEDAEENLRRITAEVKEAGAQILLVSQLLARDGRAEDVYPYFSMEQALAEELEGLHYVDVRGIQDIHEDAEILLDMNHMSADGHRLLGEALTPAIYSVLSGDSGNQAQ